jgi:MATE family multidrug resistance protein
MAGAPVLEAERPQSVALQAGPDFASHLVELSRLAVPMIVSRAGLAAMGIADAIMVSRYSPSQFAMLSLADGTLGRVTDICAAFVLGGLILVPRAFGAGRLGECATIWRRSVTPALVLGIVAAVLGFAGTPLFRALREPAALASGAGSVAIVLGFGTAAALLALGAAVFIEGIKRPAIVAVSVVLANVLNIALNALLIGGAGAVPALGARGSALSTTIVRFVLAAVLAGYAWRFGMKHRGADPGGETAPVVQQKLNLSSAAIAAVMIALTASLTVFAGWLGPLALAILAATFTLNAPVMLVVLGVADATAIRVASHDREGRAIVRASALVVGAVALAVAIAWSAFPHALAAIFTHDPAMQQGLAALIPLASALVVLDGMCFLVVSALRAMRDILWPTAIEIGTLAALAPLALLFAFGLSLGVRGLILAAIASASLRVALLAWRFLQVTRAVRLAAVA